MALLKEIASIVKNDIQSGLKGIGNYSFSIEQLEKDIIIKRNAIIKKYSVQGILPENELIQNLNCLILECVDIADCCEGVKSGKTALKFEVPRFSSVFGTDVVKYAGPINKMMPYKVYYDHTWIYNSYARVTKKKPFVWFDLGTINENDTINGYVFNVPRLKYISVAAIFEDPYQVAICNCKEEQELRFPAPEFIVDEIIQAITYKHINLYKANQQVVPNTQTSQGKA